MKTNQNLRRLGEKKGSNNKISHAEFAGGAPRTSGFSTHGVAVNNNNLRGRFQIKFAMTIDNNRAFTLIELLVVVLIIGILAGVALPQYNQAVLKSRYIQLQVLDKSLAEAEMLYYTENNAWAEKFSDLDIELPSGWTVNESGDTAYLGNYIITIFLISDKSRGAINGFYNNQLQHVVSFPSLEKQCRANPDYSSAQQVCKSVGGTWADKVDGWDAYRLP